jgi:hypothetical protein
VLAELPVHEDQWESSSTILISTPAQVANPAAKWRGGLSYFCSSFSSLLLPSLFSKIRRGFRELSIDFGEEGGLDPLASLRSAPARRWVYNQHCFLS